MHIPKAVLLTQTIISLPRVGSITSANKKGQVKNSPNPLFKKQALKMKILNSVRRNEK